MTRTALPNRPLPQLGNCFHGSQFFQTPKSRPSKEAKALIPAEARITVITTILSPSPPQSGGEGRGGYGDNTSLTIVCASKGSNQPRETCCQFCHSPLKAMNTGVVTKLATSHGERLPDQMFRRWCEKRQPCVVIKVLAMSCHRAVRWHNSNSLSPALSPRFTGREG